MNQPQTLRAYLVEKTGGTAQDHDSRGILKDFVGSTVYAPIMGAVNLLENVTKQLSETMREKREVTFQDEFILFTKKTIPEVTLNKMADDFYKTLGFQPWLTSGHYKKQDKEVIVYMTHDFN